MINSAGTISDNQLKASNTSSDLSISVNGSSVVISNNTDVKNDTNPDKPVNPVIKITAVKTSVIYLNNFKVRVLSDGNSVGSGKFVYLKIAGKTLKAKTNKFGYAVFKLSVKPKKYTATVTYGTSRSFKISVTTIFKANNIKVKKSAKVLNIKVSLKKVNDKYLSGKKVTLKFKGKSYKLKTNSKGAVTFKISKDVLKKLTVGKKYTYAVSYGKDTVKKTVLVKK